MNHLNPLEILIKIGTLENIPFEILISPFGQIQIKIDGLTYVSNTASYTDLNQVAFRILIEGVKKLCEHND